MCCLARGGEGVAVSVALPGDLYMRVETTFAMLTLVLQKQSALSEISSVPLVGQGTHVERTPSFSKGRPEGFRRVLPQQSREGVQEDAALCFLGDNEQVQDTLGLGRIPAFWWTQNCKYNAAYDVQRLNVDSKGAVEALTQHQDHHAHVRYRFTRDRPDLVSFIIALQT